MPGCHSQAGSLSRVAPSQALSASPTAPGIFRISSPWARTARLKARSISFESAVVGEQRFEHGRDHMLAADRANLRALAGRPAVEALLLLGDCRLLIETSPDQLVNGKTRCFEMGRGRGQDLLDPLLSADLVFGQLFQANPHALDEALIAGPLFGSKPADDPVDGGVADLLGQDHRRPGDCGDDQLGDLGGAHQYFPQPSIQPENDTLQMARQLSAFQAHSHPIRGECRSLILIDGAWRRINPTAGSRRPGGANRPKSGAWVTHKWRISDAWVAHFCVGSVR